MEQIAESETISISAIKLHLYEKKRTRGRLVGWTRDNRSLVSFRPFSYRLLKLLSF